jgi:hypothetical protein
VRRCHRQAARDFVAGTFAGQQHTSIGAKARWGVNASAKTKELRPLLDKVLITPPEVCATEILTGVARGKRRILTGNGARSVDFLSRLLPVRHVGIIKAVMGF